MTRFNLVDYLDDRNEDLNDRIADGYAIGDQDYAYSSDEIDDIRAKEWEKIQDRVSVLIEDEKVSVSELSEGRDWLRSNVRWLTDAQIDEAWAWAEEDALVLAA